MAEGEKNGIGTKQSHERYEILINRLNNSETMEIDDVRDALDSVSKDNFGEFESTEWSIVMNQTTGALGKANSEEVMNLLTELYHDGQSILMVTHDVRAAIHGNRILYLEDGKILDEPDLPSLRKR